MYVHLLDKRRVKIGPRFMHVICHLRFIVPLLLQPTAGFGLQSSSDIDHAQYITLVYPFQLYTCIHIVILALFDMDLQALAVS